MLTGVRLEIEDDLITLAATDRYRLAVREFAWRPETPGVSAAVLVPARTLADAAKTLTSGPEIVLSLSSGSSGEGILGLSGKDRQTTTRLLDAEFVKYRAIMPSESNAHAMLPVDLFTDAAKRVALVAERGTPLRCEFTPGQVTLRAGGTDDEGQAEERCDVEFDGEPLTIGFNPTFLLDGLAAVHTERARMDFTSPLKPAVLSGVEEPAADDGSRRPGRAAGQLPLPDHAGAPARLIGRRLSRDARARHSTMKHRFREPLRGDAVVQLGLIGLGKMGGNMAERLRRAGHEVVGLRPLAGEAGRRQPARAGRGAVRAARRLGDGALRRADPGDRQGAGRAAQPRRRRRRGRQLEVHRRPGARRDAAARRASATSTPASPAASGAWRTATR